MPVTSSRVLRGCVRPALSVCKLVPIGMVVTPSAAHEQKEAYIAIGLKLAFFLPFFS